MTCERVGESGKFLLFNRLLINHNSRHICLNLHFLLRSSENSRHEKTGWLTWSEEEKNTFRRNWNKSFIIRWKVQTRIDFLRSCSVLQSISQFTIKIWWRSIRKRCVKWIRRLDWCENDFEPVARRFSRDQGREFIIKRNNWIDCVYRLRNPAWVDDVSDYSGCYAEYRIFLLCTVWASTRLKWWTRKVENTRLRWWKVLSTVQRVAER